MQTYNKKTSSQMMMMIVLIIVATCLTTWTTIHSVKMAPPASRKLTRKPEAGPYAGYNKIIANEYKKNVLSKKFSDNNHNKRNQRLLSAISASSPEQVHISYGIPAISSMVVSWAAGTPPTAAPASSVHYSENIDDIKNGKC